MRSLRMWRWGDCPDYPDGPSITIRVLKRWRRGGGGGAEGQSHRETESCWLWRRRRRPPAKEGRRPTKARKDMEGDASLLVSPGAASPADTLGLSPSDPLWISDQQDRKENNSVKPQCLRELVTATTANNADAKSARRGSGRRAAGGWGRGGPRASAQAAGSPGNVPPGTAP